MHKNNSSSLLKGNIELQSMCCSLSLVRNRMTLSNSMFWLKGNTEQWYML